LNYTFKKDFNIVSVENFFENLQDKDLFPAQWLIPSRKKINIANMLRSF
jgi:hypothetical protein